MPQRPLARAPSHPALYSVQPGVGVSQDQDPTPPRLPLRHRSDSLISSLPEIVKETITPLSCPTDTCPTAKRKLSDYVPSFVVLLGELFINHAKICFLHR